MKELIQREGQLLVLSRPNNPMIDVIEGFFRRKIKLQQFREFFDPFKKENNPDIYMDCIKKGILNLHSVFTNYLADLLQENYDEFEQIRRVFWLFREFSGDIVGLWLNQWMYEWCANRKNMEKYILNGYQVVRFPEYQMIWYEPESNTAKSAGQNCLVLRIQKFIKDEAVVYYLVYDNFVIQESEYVDPDATKRRKEMRIAIEKRRR